LLILHFDRDKIQNFDNYYISFNISKMIGLNSQNDLSKYDILFAGAASGFITRLLCQPFDVAKIRFQLQIEPISNNCKTAKYTSLYQTFKTIAKEEGLISLWKGHWSGQHLSIVYSCVQFTLYEYTSKILYNILNNPLDKKYPISFVSGSIAGLAASLASLPFDGIRTRLVAQNEPKIVKSTLQACKIIYKNQGFKGFFYGAGPNLAQIAPYTGLNFTFYNLFNEIWLLFNKGSTLNHPTTIQSLICGGTAGLLSKLIIYPLDLIKKRLQIQGFQFVRRNLGQNKKYRGFFDCVIQTLRNESFSGFYKGLYPSFLKAIISSALHFASYEQIIQRLSLKHSRDNR
jgi:PREDICTED: similar to mitochondrial solute carrier family 25 member 19, partial